MRVGCEARASDENGLVAQVQRHATEAHGMALSDDDALLLVSRAGLEHRTDRGPSSPDNRTDEEER